MKRAYQTALAVFLSVAIPACGGGGGGGGGEGAAVPAAPASLSASATASDTVQLSWQDNSTNESGFHIYRLPDTTTPVKSVGADVTSTTVTGLQAQTHYQFQVTAYNTEGESGPSNTFTITTPAPPVPVPAAPSGLSAIPYSSSEIRLAWTDNSDDEDELRVYRGTSPDTINALVGSVQADSTAFTDDTVVAGRTYFYVVRAHNPGGESPGSDTLELTTYSPVGRWEFILSGFTNCPPYGPQSLGIPGWGSVTEGSPRQITFTTNMGTLTGSYGFATTAYIVSLTGTLATPSYGNVFVSLTLYISLDWQTCYTVQGGINHLGCSGTLSNIPFRVVDPYAPAAPGQLAATPLSATTVELIWQDNSVDETEFRIYRGTYLFGVNTLVATLDPGTEAWRDTGLAPGTGYVYKVVGYNAAGASPWSNFDGANTFASPTAAPAVPTGLSATPTSGTTVSLSWTDASSSEDGFKVYRGTSSGNINTLLGTLGVGVAQFNDSALTPGAAYYYQVASYNLFGESSRSGWVSATTPSGIPIPTAPSGLTATTASETEIQLSWTDNSGNESGFRIYQATGSCGSSFAFLGTVPAGTTSELIYLLNPGTTYCYKISAYNQGGESAYSNTDSATTTSSPAKLRIVNDLYNLDQGQYYWSLWNQIVYVRIGPYLPVVGAECSSVINNNTYERLNPVSIGDEPGPAIDPGYNSPPSVLTYEDFDVSSFTSGTYCVFIQAGWWEYQYDVNSGWDWWEIHPTSAINCAGQAVYGSKWNAFYIYNHFSGTRVENASSWLPHFQWQGTSFCQ